MFGISFHLYLLIHSNNESGAPIAMKVGSGETYFFEKNAQGDIVALFNNSGAEVARIGYDAYGNTLYIDNPDNLYIPFRYRGYYYDADTGFYYLQSRYYDPETGRFINADATSFISQNYMANIFAYCGNNPINTSDHIGLSIDKPYIESIYNLSYQQFINWIDLIDKRVRKVENNFFLKFLDFGISLIPNRPMQIGITAVNAAMLFFPSETDEMNSVRYYSSDIATKGFNKSQSSYMGHYGLDYRISFLNGYSGWELKIQYFFGRFPGEAYIFDFMNGSTFSKLIEYIEQIQSQYYTFRWGCEYTYFKYSYGKVW